MNTQDHIAALRDNIARCHTELALLSALPSDLAIRSLVHVKPYWYLTLDAGSFADVARALPALPMEADQDSWGQWTPSPGETSRTAPYAYPVWCATDTLGRGAEPSPIVLQWFTRIEGSGLVRVSLPYSSADFTAPKGYALQGERTRLWLRQPVPPVVAPLASPSEVFSQALETFMQSHGYHAAQQRIARACAAVSRRNILLCEADLPAPAEGVLCLGEATLTILTAGADHPEPWPAGSALAGLARMGSFWRYFDAQQATSLLAFCNAHRCDGAAADHAYYVAELARAREAAAEFAKEYALASTPARNRPCASTLEYALQAKTGLPVTVSSRDSLMRRAGVDHIRHEFWLSLSGRHEGFSLDVPAQYDPAGFDWTRPAFMEYAAL